MNKFNVIIFKLQTLYEILIEIKSQLNFNIIYFDEINDNFNKHLNNNPDTLIISDKINTKFKNFILYNKTQKVSNLIQQINVFFSKTNYEIKSNILIAKYTINTNSRLIIRDDNSLKLTEREIDLLIYLNNSTEEKNIIDLQKNVWKHTRDLETHTVETHIYRLRKKIFEVFKDDKFIINNKKGYKLYKWKKETLLLKISYQGNLVKRK